MLVPHRRLVFCDGVVRSFAHSCGRRIQEAVVHVEAAQEETIA